MAASRKATRYYRAKRRNGNYNTTPVQNTSRLKTTKQSSNVPIYHVRRKLHFGRPPPKPRSGTSDTPSKHMTSSTRSRKMKQLQVKMKSPTKSNKISPRLKHRYISREVQDLLQMSSCYVLPNRLRSSPKCKGHCHGDSLSAFIGYKLHTSPEHLNLSRIE